MVGNISDMTAAALVVSAVDNSSVTKNSSTLTDNVDVDSSNAEYQQDLAPKVEQAQAGSETDSKDANQKGEKRQALDSLNEKFVSEMTRELNELMSKLNCDLEFQYHKEVDIMSVKMVDKKTNEVIKEYPPEEMVEGMIKAQEWLGAFLDKNA